MKRPYRITTALLLSLSLVVGCGECCSAGVNDNVITSSLEQKVGEPSNANETIFSLLHQILTELAYVRNAVTSDESVSNADLKELIIGNYSSDKLCTQPTIIEARGYNNHLTVTWTKPTTTNVAVAKYNVYICPSDTAPLDLTDFTKIGSVAYNEFENNFTYVSPELLPNVNYWVMVTSESKRGVNNDQLVLNGSNIMKCVDKSAIASNIFTITEENNTVTSCYTTQTFDYILNIPEEINGKTVVGVGSPDGNNATVAAGNFRDILIPDTITQVNSYFLNSKNACLNLGVSKDNCDSFNRYDKLPDAVTDVGDYAFNAETGLKDSNLILPTSLVNIGAYAYSNTKLSTVKFTEGTLQKIGNSAFENCTQINTVYVPNVHEFGEIAFKGCTGLVNLECNVTTLTTQFQNCHALENIVLDELVTSIGAYSFLTTNNYTHREQNTYPGDYYAGIAQSGGNSSVYSYKNYAALSNAEPILYSFCLTNNLNLDSISTSNHIRNFYITCNPIIQLSNVCNDSLMTFGGYQRNNAYMNGYDHVTKECYSRTKYISSCFTPRVLIFAPDAQSHIQNYTNPPTYFTGYRRYPGNALKSDWYGGDHTWTMVAYSQTDGIIQTNIYSAPQVANNDLQIKQGSTYNELQGEYASSLVSLKDNVDSLSWHRDLYEKFVTFNDINAVTVPSFK